MTAMKRREDLGAVRYAFLSAFLVVVMGICPIGWAESGEEEGLIRLTGHALPIVGDNTTDVEVADVDDDGDADLLFTNFDSDDRLLFNDGAGSFTEAAPGTLPQFPEGSYGAAVADLDGDGRLDIAAVAERGSNEFRWWRNEG